MKNYFKILFFVVSSYNICYSQELKKIPLTEKEKNKKAIDKYMYSGAEESIVLLLYKNGTYVYNAFTNIIGKQFSEGIWRRAGNTIEMNSTYGPNRLPVNIHYDQKADNPSRIRIQNVFNSKGEPIENTIIAVNNDTVKCSPIMDTCTGNFKKIERIRVFIGNGECYSKWIEINREDFRTIDVVIPLAVDFDRYLAFDKKKYILSKVGLKQVNN